MWKSIPNWEGLYEASMDGEIRSLGSLVSQRVGKSYRKGRILARAIKPNGYPAVTLARDNKHFQVTVHRLIAWTFIGPQAPGIHVRHLNGQKTDCRYDNLAYGTPQENEHDKETHGIRFFRKKIA